MENLIYLLMNGKLDCKCYPALDKYPLHFLLHIFPLSLSANGENFCDRIVLLEVGLSLMLGGAL